MVLGGGRRSVQRAKLTAVPPVADPSHEGRRQVPAPDHFDILKPTIELGSRLKHRAESNMEDVRRLRPDYGLEFRKRKSRHHARTLAHLTRAEVLGGVEGDRKQHGQDKRRRRCTGVPHFQENAPP